jgi:hypothetical protein
VGGAPGPYTLTRLAMLATLSRKRERGYLYSRP